MWKYSNLKCWSWFDKPVTVNVRTSSWNKYLIHEWNTWFNGKDCKFFSLRFGNIFKIVRLNNWFESDQNLSIIFYNRCQCNKIGLNSTATLIHYHETPINSLRIFLHVKWNRTTTIHEITCNSGSICFLNTPAYYEKCDNKKNNNKFT